uniref:Elicitorlike transglutaminase M81like protein putati n=1 Tax=Albugo laibachii Nc14 TaxID=890382 RepID=F0VZK2_9STRA|nr:elicitorlike transglutaminase M81like protein putati [Albugo laibachii Nc14]|eukprot:CCA14232.1 elicitorlike transglutaminase M81like protein putati [Albugo laibachii Nc14]
MTSYWRLVAFILGLIQRDRSSNGLPMNSSPYYSFTSRRLGDSPATAAEGAEEGTARKLTAFNQTEITELENLEQLLGIKLEYNLSTLIQLTSRNITHIPWTSSYWPNWRNGIGRPWEGNTTRSPAEKYGTCFDNPKFFGLVTKAYGVRSEQVGNIVPCTSNADCKGVTISSSGCAKLPQESSGKCMLKWYGLCHAWAPASLMEDEPVCPVMYNNMLFQPFDIKALLIQAYDGALVETAFIGQRCLSDNNDTDKYGRYLSPERLDINAGSFFIAVMNLIGLHDKGFILDKDAGRPVWNQPAFGYQIKKFAMVDPKQVVKDLYHTDTYPFNDKMERLAYVKLKLYWMGEQISNRPSISTGRYQRAVKSSTYHMLLELNDGYEILGGEFIKNSTRIHPDFIWLMKEPAPADTLTNLGLRLSDVRDLVKKSRECLKKPQ